jgi:hypothetical protein
MHEQHEIEKMLKTEARRISKKLHGAPVVIIVGGSTQADIPRTMTATYIQGGDVRLRDLLGLLQASIQIESWKHMSWQLQPNPALKRTRRKRRAA